MSKNNEKKSGCIPSNIGSGCCRVESVVTIDSKGQILLPKDLREKTNIQAGDKLVIATWGDQNGPCCITLIKADNFGDMVKNFLGPMMKDFTQ